MSTTPLLPDAAARESIVNDLDVNLVVEAAAGTGKTTCLVARLLNLFRKGALARDRRLAAVTFTHKAAAELRERLERKLAEALNASDLSARDRRHLSAARAALPDCHIGTIHSFCARMLRERPVEAGVSPDFSEIDQSEDLLLRRRAWDEFADQMRRGRHRRLYTVFQQFELDHEALGAGFEKFADYPDIAEWPGSDADVAGVDVAAFVAGVDAFHAGLAALNPDLDEIESGNDQLLPIMQILCRRYPRLRFPLGLGDAFRLARLFRENPKPVQKQWLPLGMEKDDVRERAAAYARFWAETVRPFRDQCLAAVYGAAMEAFILARDGYDRLRRERNVLNFQDLLMAAAAMLRDYPEVRRDLSDRYARLLVDEVQDTDPVQAEIMFLLASSEPRRRDWRRCPPRPGSLFIVGDPKQSIYRFRRADIVVYQEVKRLIVAGGGRVLGLSSNFRSQPEILDWVNRTYCHSDARDIAPAAAAASGRFTAAESPYSPAYVPLRPGLPPGADGSFHGVFYLETIPVDKKGGVGEREIVLDEARRIAGFIRDAVDRGLPLPAGRGVRPAGPGDFMIVTYQKSPAAVYADALRRIGLDCQVSSGGSLSDSPALALFRGYLEALANPCDPVRLLAVLRGPLFGVCDPDLYRWKKAGGVFDFLSAAPAIESPLSAILGLMKKHRRLAAARHPVLLLEKIAADLGLWALACLGEDPSGAVGAVETAFELLRAERRDIPTLGALADRLSWHMDNHERDPLPARQWPGQAVRVMNLHKTKGLEAPVVFLASTRTVRGRGADFAVRRENGAASGGMVLTGGEFGNVVLARPEAWEAMAAEEELFLAAEKTRLNYVAATRAGTALVVSVHQSGAVWKSAFLPEFIPGATIEKRLPEPTAPARIETRERLERIDADALAQPTALRDGARTAMLGETVRVSRAKPGRAGLNAGAIDASLEEALALGEVTHRLLERDLDGDDAEELAARLLREFDLPVGMRDETLAMVAAVRGSEVWRRALRAKRAFRETPYAVRAERDGAVEIQRGIIDLAFEEEDGWVVVDYKSDRLPEPLDFPRAAQRHVEQLEAYGRAWERATGATVKEKGVFFLRYGRFVAI